MISTRIIPCLDVDNGRVVKGVCFSDLQDAGDPAELARRYNDQGADEITFLDIGASHQSRDILLHVVEQVSREVFVPLTVGGGIRSIVDIRRVLNAGADKVAICSAALKNPRLITEASRIFGSQCIVLSVDAKRGTSGWSAFLKGGRLDSGREVLDWAQHCVDLGAGEILLNSIDNDGTGLGYDLELCRLVSTKLKVPVIASGGAGTVEQIFNAVNKGRADAVLLASLLHYGELSIGKIKTFLADKGVNVRW